MALPLPPVALFVYRRARHLTAVLDGSSAVRDLRKARSLFFGWSPAPAAKTMCWQCDGWSLPGYGPAFTQFFASLLIQYGWRTK
jgi:hypothetical protein